MARLSRSAGLWAAALAAAAWLAWRAGADSARFDPVLAPNQAQLEILPGEFLYHGLPSGSYTNRLFRHMPLTRAVAAGLSHLDAGTRSVLLTALKIAPSLLSGALGLAIGGPAGAAAAVILCPRPWDLDPNIESSLFTALLALTAAALAWRARRPTPARSAAAGAAIGVSLLCRSPLFLLPALLAARDRLALRLRGRDLLVLPAAALALLAPCVLANLVVLGKLWPFEAGRADNNIVGAALGLVVAFDGDPRQLAGLGPDASVLLWSAAEVLRHPLRYLAGLGGRAWYAVALQPALFAAAGAGLAAARRRPEARECALLLAYFLGLYGTMPLIPRYLEPAYPLLAGLAGGGLASLLPRWKDEPEPGPFVLAALAPLLAAGLWTGALFARYAVFAGGAATDLAVPAGSADAPLLFLQGDYHLERGRPELALEPLRRAAELSPEDHEYELKYALALTATRAASEESLARLIARRAVIRDGQGWFLDVLRRLDSGDRAGASRAYREGLREWRAGFFFSYPTSTALERETLERLIAQDRWPERSLQLLLRAWPEDRRAALSDRVAKLSRPGA